MRFSTLIYTIKQGIVNIFRNKWYSLASMATISACLFMFGIFYSLVANFQYIVKEAQDGVAVTVFFEEGISDERIAEIGSLIEKRAEVSHVNFVSADGKVSRMIISENMQMASGMTIHCRIRQTMRCI